MKRKFLNLGILTLLSFTFVGCTSNVGNLATNPNNTNNQNNNNHQNDANHQNDMNHSNHTNNGDISTHNYQSPGVITEEQAKQIAFDHAKVNPSAIQHIRVKTDFEMGQEVYDIQFYYDTKEYDYDIAKSNGNIISYDQEIEDDFFFYNQTQTSPSNTASLTKDEAVQMVLQRLPEANANNIRIYQDYDDGRLQFEGSVYVNFKEYEFSIDAQTKQFTEWSLD